MKFALIENNRVEASPNQKGLCPNCNRPVIAKCGDKNVWHWAHRNLSSCDSWWEPETEWHRNWKNKFPPEWQEKVFFDEDTNEKHIADVYTNYKLVIEFQHSHIDPKERTKREAFYKNMIWVVDGTRLKRDYSRFLKGKEYFKEIRKGIFRLELPEEYLPSSWLNSGCPIIFDFMGSVDPSKINTSLVATPNVLYCLFPINIGMECIIAEISSNAFISSVINGQWSVRADRFISEIIQVKKERQAQIEILQKRNNSTLLQKHIGNVTTYNRRRF